MIYSLNSLRFIFVMMAFGVVHIIYKQLFSAHFFKKSL